ncbi:MAG TPA: toxin TcdB middle/N-terminal domain-containing protein, partial [Prosthecobacter sp.]
MEFSYNSGNGNGPLGMGWKLDVPFLQRQTDKGLPRYLTTDTIIDSAGEELVKLADGSFRSENEGKSVRYEKQGDDSWLARLPNGSVMVMGGTNDSRLYGSAGTFSWHVSSITDTNGNRSTFSYIKDNGQIFLSEVAVGEHVSLPSETFTASFLYESGRPDVIVDYRPGFARETRLRLSGVVISHGTRRLAQYKIAYHLADVVSLLKSITLFGDDRSSLGNDALVNRDFLPPHFFDYQAAAFAQDWQMFSMTNVPAYGFAANQMELADANGDALPDLAVYEQSSGKYQTALSNGHGRPFGSLVTVENSPVGEALNSSGTQFADLRGDGKTRLLVQDGTTFNFRSFETPARFTAATTFNIPTAFFYGNQEVRFIDINNDKAMDLMMISSDGRFDFLINGQSSGQANYVLPNPPAPPSNFIRFASGWQTADLNGDRLADLFLPATQEQGGCAFHYAQGWGKFAARRFMANSPLASDISARGIAGLTPVDVNQDGWLDCVYVASGVVKIWINQSGNSFAAPVVISNAQIPAYQEGITGVRFADVNGNGSTDIVWNRTDLGAADRFRYLELSPGTKPHLLTKATNELGGSITVEYISSVDYMVEAAGTAEQWTSVSPISIPVVRALVENDGRGNDYRSEITYRNPYYDGVEKEFRGFEFASRKEIGDAAQGAPSQLTLMQFHTGADVEALKGKPRFLEIRDFATGSVFSTVSSHWQPRQLALALDSTEARRITLAYQDSEETFIYEGGPAAQAVILQREFNVDDFGNNIRTADYGRVEGANRSAWDDERVTITAYSAGYPSGLSAWLLDAPIQTEVQDESGAVIARSQNFYDDPAFAGTNLGSVTKGNLTMERRWHDIAGNRHLSASRSIFDGYGNVQGIYDPLGTPGNHSPGHYRSFVYDTKIHTYPETEIVHTGNVVQATLTATATYDVGLGVLKTFTDFNSHTTELLYDTFGRLTDMIRPGDTLAAPTASYIYQLSQSHPSGILNY